MTIPQPIGESALSVLRRALQTEDEKLLEELRQNAGEILRQLDRLAEEDRESQLALEPGKVSAEWLAKIYSILSGVTDADACAIEDEACVREMLEARADWEASIGAAFAQALLPSWLPGRLLDIDAWFGSLPKVPAARVEYLRQTPAVRAGGPQAQRLCVYGITPMTVYRGVHAVYLLVDRMVDYGYLRSDEAILLSVRSDSGEPAIQRLDRASVVAEINEYAGCSREAADSLLRWFIPLGQFHPQLFYGMLAAPRGEDALLLRIAEHANNANVYYRWGVLPVVKGVEDWMEAGAGGMVGADF